MIDNSHPNILLLSQVARRLGPLLPEVVFVGGATVSLYLTRQDLPPVRSTRDVDVIMEVTSRVNYHPLQKSYGIKVFEKMWKVTFYAAGASMTF